MHGRLRSAPVRHRTATGPQEPGRNAQVPEPRLPAYASNQVPRTPATPSNSHMDIHQYLRKSGGVARSGQLRDAGFLLRDLSRLTALGATQPRRGIFVLPEYDKGLLAAVLNNGRLSCASAAGHYGLWLRSPPEQPHLACNHGHGNGFIRHRTVRFPGHPSLPVAAVEDVVLHALGCLPPPASAAMATSAIRLHGVPRELLASRLQADRSGRARRILSELDLRAESIVEVDAQHLLRTHGIAYDAQVFLPGIGRVDFLLGGFLIVEIDGFASTRSGRTCFGTGPATTCPPSTGMPSSATCQSTSGSTPGRVISEITTVLAAGPRKPGR